MCDFLSENNLIVIGFINSFFNICNYNCKCCSLNSSLQNLHLIFMNLWIWSLWNSLFINIIVKFSCEWLFTFTKSLLNICNYDCKHCSSNSSLQNLHLIFMNLWIWSLWNSLFPSKTIWTVQNHFGSIEGQDISLSTPL